jgi:formamidopyrimidine-DNA glycosylase
MPELPEVEIARRNLARWLEGATIASARVGDKRILDDAQPPLRVTKALAGNKVLRVERRGKWLKLVLARGTLFSHLGMTGKWVLRDADAPATRSERLRLDLRRKNETVRYLDPRLFGRLVLVGKGEEDIAEYRELGPDPLLDGIDTKRLREALSKRRRAIKEVLLDQAVLAGVGNIYATEALFRARVDPHRPANTLTATELGRVARAIEASFRKTLAEEDGPEITYVEERGAKNPFAIYGHGGDPCPRCKRPLTRTVIGGRGTVYCRHCQT